MATKYQGKKRWTGGEDSLEIIGAWFPEGELQADPKTGALHLPNGETAESYNVLLHLEDGRVLVLSEEKYQEGKVSGEYVPAN